MHKSIEKNEYYILRFKICRTNTNFFSALATIWACLIIPEKQYIEYTTSRCAGHDEFGCGQNYCVSHRSFGVDNNIRLYSNKQFRTRSVLVSIKQYTASCVQYNNISDTPFWTISIMLLRRVIKIRITALKYRSPSGTQYIIPKYRTQ